MPNPNPTQDANPEGASSPPSAQEGAASPQPPAPTEEPTIAEVAQAAYDASTKEDAEPSPEGPGHLVTPTEDKPDGQVDPPPGPETPQESEQEKAQREETEKEEKGEKTPEGEPLPPFHEHPRWKEVVSQRDALDLKAKELQPQAESWQKHEAFLSRFDIPREEFVNTMNFLALMRTDPAKARELLVPFMRKLDAFDPEAIPADVQKMIDDNEMTPAAAKEFAKLRAQIASRDKGGELTQAQKQRENHASLVSSMDQWDHSKRGQDPDFVPKKDEASPDGLWEMTAKGYTYLAQRTPPTSPTSACALLDKAYKDAKAVLTRYASARTPTKPQPSSQRSQQPSRKEPETIKEVVAAAAREHGIQWDGGSNGN